MSVAKKMRVSGSREKSREIISGSSLYLFGQLIPTFALADLGPHPPSERLGFFLYAPKQPLDTLPYARLALLGQVVAVDVAFERLEVRGEGAPEPPVRGAQARDVGAVYRVAIPEIGRASCRERV